MSKLNTTNPIQTGLFFGLLGPEAMTMKLGRQIIRSKMFPLRPAT